jgi:hypothetical protein
MEWTSSARAAPHCNSKGRCTVSTRCKWLMKNRKPAPTLGSWLLVVPPSALCLQAVNRMSSHRPADNHIEGILTQVTNMWSYTSMPIKSAQAVTPFICIRKVTGSNLDQDTSYILLRISCFYPFPSANAGIVSLNRPRTIYFEFLLLHHSIIVLPIRRHVLRDPDCHTIQMCIPPPPRLHGVLLNWA